MLSVRFPGLRSMLYALLLGAGCACAQQPSGSLTVAGPSARITFSVAALRAMPQVTVHAWNGHEHVQQTYTGVPLITLMRRAGAPQDAGVRGPALSQYIVATGSDHYHAVLALAEIEPAFHPGSVLVADSLDGKPLDSKQGPLKLVVTDDREPARWVRNLVSVELKEQH